MGSISETLRGNKEVIVVAQDRKFPARKYKRYVRRWGLKAYVRRIRKEAYIIGSDGCTGVPDWFLDVCLEHDLHYAYHWDMLTGARMTKEDADIYLKWGIQYFSFFGRLSPMAWWRYTALSKKKGLGLGSRAWETGPARRLLHAPFHGARKEGDK